MPASAEPRNSADELWTTLGSLSEDQAMHVLTRLFALYEKRLQQDLRDPAALDFFRHLGQAMEQVCQCNSNRR